MNVASEANSVENWDRLWSEEGDDSWRQHALAEVYDRIVQLCPAGARVVDLGGGRGLLGRRLVAEKHCHVTVVDHSSVALAAACEAGCATDEQTIGLGTAQELLDWMPDVVVSTETLEHLPADVRDAILDAIRDLGCKAFLSVPNDRLGPEVEPQHTCQWTALGYLTRLRQLDPHARVECLGPLASEHGAPSYLLGVVGFPARPHTLSMTLPVRDEADDLALTLASFRGVADEIVVGVDYRTKDRTREIAAQYAEVVFDIDDPRGPDPDEHKIPDNGVNFAHVRNRCIERCSSQWIFMTEGHESLLSGVDTLLALGSLLVEGEKVGYVWRTGQGQRWAFPWLFANDTRLRFVRPTHNQLEIPMGMREARLPQVRTHHRRSHRNRVARSAQRIVQNRKTLLDDWVTNKNETSLYYLASEMRELDSDRSVERMQEYLALPPKNGTARYQVRLQLAKEYADRGRLADARATLIRCPEDDWTRIEHWLWLGDLAYETDRLEEALQFWQYAATTIGHPPFTLWWIDEDAYTYLPAQRLVMAYASLGRFSDAMHWAKRAEELLPEDAPDEVRREAAANIRVIEDKMAGLREPTEQENVQ